MSRCALRWLRRGRCHAYRDYSLQNSAKRLASRFPDAVVLLMWYARSPARWVLQRVPSVASVSTAWVLCVAHPSPARFHEGVYACFDNFADVDAFGQRSIVTTAGGLGRGVCHLAAVVAAIAKALAGRHTGSADVATLPLTVVGFSKGSIVLRALMGELAMLPRMRASRAVELAKGLAARVKRLVWMDAMGLALQMQVAEIAGFAQVRAGGPCSRDTCAHGGGAVHFTHMDACVGSYLASL